MSLLSWTRRPLVGFDVETTGLDVETDRIVTGSVVRWGGGLPTEPRTWRSDLGGAEISADATAIHGITTEAARAAGRPAAEAVAEIAEALSEYASAGWPIVVMNAPFDLTMLERECARYGVRSVWDATPVVLDPWVMDKYLDRYRRGKRTLVALCHHYGVKLEGGAHNSEVDAKAACGVAWKIGSRYPRIGHEDIGELHEMQARWARELRDDYLAWQMERLGACDDAPYEWPFIPAPTEAGT
ncbi:exonuclease domain-containing protein [Streptomyces afghaniensis]|uniref:exonuclease domain-containing protein n=1 Tax=Streptomyces afghaniensis TaxID=66865 RepID=UPI002781433A|nr:exonuclease domain-containing protein [Streptomyces afghaniensis]MDQ1018800.1 DNA polymerase-3 subunit epsilon [Streptomyces afghaniensis]